MRLVSRLLVLALLCAALTARGPAIEAAGIGTLIVTRVDDPAPGACDTDCSLREAIIAANLGPAADILLPDLGQPFKLTIAGNDEGAGATGDLDITVGAHIIGPGTIEQTTNDRVFAIASGVSATLTRVTVTGGDAVALGGGILNGGELTLDRSVVVDNDAGTNGGGVHNTGTLTIDRSTVDGNLASGQGGGVFNNGTMSVTASTISRNESASSGGGIYNLNGQIDITRSTISENETGGSGGGIFHNAGEVDVAFSTITQNDADADDDLSGSGGGIATTIAEDVDLLASAVVSNRDGNGPSPAFVSDCSGTVISQGFNVLESVPECTGITDGINDDEVTNLHFLSDFLLNNGGPTATHRVSSVLSSPLRNRVPASLCGGAPGDQRGVAAPQPGADCEVGAYELALCQGVVVNVVGTSSSETLNGTAGADGIFAGGGNDKVNGFAGGDGVCGQGGRDKLMGGLDDDKLDGGGGTDRCFGDQGADTFTRCEAKKQG